MWKENRIAELGKSKWNTPQSQHSPHPSKKKKKSNKLALQMASNFILPFQLILNFFAKSQEQVDQMFEN